MIIKFKIFFLQNALEHGMMINDFSVLHRLFQRILTFDPLLLPRSYHCSPICFVMFGLCFFVTFSLHKYIGLCYMIHI